jgi:hypothetical protein
MLGEFPETSDELQIEPDRLFSGYRWNKRALITGIAGFSVVILVLGVLALVLLGIPIALINGLVAGNWQAAEQALAELWRLSPLLLAAEFVLAWLLIALLLVARRVLEKFGIAIA